MSGLHVHGRGAVHHGCTCTARCATRSIARCPSRSATGSTRSRWCERYGADALRYSLVSGMSVGTDVILDPDDLETSFGAGPQLRQQAVERGPLHPLQPGRPAPPARGQRDERRAARRAHPGGPVDHRALRRHGARGHRGYERFRLNEAAAAVYRFIWSDLADWYIEQIKPRLYGDVPGGDVARAVAAQTFDVALRLLHPVMPFVTETLWRRFPGRPSRCLDLGGAVAPARPAARRMPTPCASSGWSRRSWRHPGHPRRVRRAAGPGRCARS